MAGIGAALALNGIWTIVCQLAGARVPSPHGRLGGGVDAAPAPPAAPDGRGEPTPTGYILCSGGGCWHSQRW
ncbi:hypothetical protein CC85DRAFT_289347 [Cutaneotrichosporon oleaginosum]|uniref:Uncharacterized protein n=1 Tax=Cutaneotrichosporon oleaginosum TaxID=879819 RepID=A0A0J0XC34_9TREE|nr:uncharacterized protein CC85DRAFT_289347 [Cutaneotrichosporon oleaginosum]KLT38631.1 hypothetical protein CC85DRAFT_289347 [Cutaneotrichosporon oleaginosum]TXT08104.1 hypothetical protein COLE_05028 [Cutaneotrichosporon oleaginosum]